MSDYEPDFSIGLLAGTGSRLDTIETQKLVASERVVVTHVMSGCHWTLVSTRTSRASSVLAKTSSSHATHPLLRLGIHLR